MKILIMTCLTILMLTVFSEIFANSSQAEEVSDIRSPRLRSLATELEGGNGKAVDKFWKQLEIETTPMVETIEDDPNHVWVTVVCRGDQDTKNVLLVGSLARGHSLDSTLERLGDTDLWYITYWTRTDLRATYQISPNDAMIDVPMNDAVGVSKQWKNCRRDPFNPNKYGGSLIELPDAPEQPWIIKDPKAPKGEMVTQRKFSSSILDNERRISVYRPPNYDPSAEAYPMCLFFDLTIYTTVVPAPRILNNLIHAKKIPPVVAVFVGNARGLRNDELPCNDDFIEFVSTELMPWVRENYNVSTDPAKNLVAGASFGGLASSFMAFRHPELFGNVISQSGSYWWSPDTNTTFLAHEVEGEWLTRQYAEAEPKPIRFFIEIGLNENGAPSMVIVNRHFRDVLIAKGNEIVKYDEFNGGHHQLNWRGSIADALIALIGTD